MEKFIITFEPKSLRCSKAGLITAQIMIQIGKFVFPGPGWTDFIVVILEWWFQAINTVAYSDECYFQFMDGPFRVLVRPVSEQLTELVFLEDRNTEITKYYSIVKTEDIRTEIIRISRKVISLCDERGWHSDDLNVLRKKIVANGVAH